MVPRQVWKWFKAGVALASLLAGVLTAAFFVWDRYRTKPLALVVEPLVFCQTPFEIGKAYGGVEIAWEASIAISNVSDEIVAIADVEPRFPPIETTDGTKFQLLRRPPPPPLVLSGRVFDSELELMSFDEREEQLTPAVREFQHRQSAPFVLGPGQKQYYRLSYHFDVTSDPEGAVAAIKEYRNLVALLVGGRAYADGGCWGAVAPLRLLIVSSDGRRLATETTTLLVVTGCMLNLPQQPSPTLPTAP